MGKQQSEWRTDGGQSRAIRFDFDTWGKATPNIAPETVSTGAGKTFREMEVDNITHLVGMNCYCEIFLATGGSVIASYHLAKWHRRIPSFIRVSLKLLVNPKHLRRAYFTPAGNGRLRLKNGTLLKVPNDQVAALRELIENQKTK